MELRYLALLAACSSGGKPVGDDAKHATPPVPVAVAVAVDAAVVAAGGVGDAAIHVQWKNVPIADRASPGRTPCNTPRAPSVKPTTVWGVPEAFVILDGAPAGEGAITLAECALSPRAVAAASIVVTSHVDRPAQIALRERGTPDALVDGAARSIMLPIAGHAVSVPLASGKVYELAIGDETAWVVADRALVTDASGTTTWRDLAVGKHAITAWLPPRAGRPGKLAHGMVEVTAGALADTTIDLAP